MFGENEAWIRRIFSSAISKKKHCQKLVILVQTYRFVHQTIWDDTFTQLLFMGSEKILFKNKKKRGKKKDFLKNILTHFLVKRHAKNVLICLLYCVIHMVCWCLLLTFIFCKEGYFPSFLFISRGRMDPVKIGWSTSEHLGVVIYKTANFH